MSVYETWIAYYTILRKDFIRILRIWPQSFLPSAVTSALYFLIFGQFLGSRIGVVHGVPYIMFVVPGLVMLAVLTNAYTNVATVMFQSKFFMRNIEEILVSPTPAWIIVVGFVSTGIIRGVVVGILVLLVALFFTHLVLHNVLIIIGFLILAALVFSLGGLVNGVYAQNIDDINIVPTFIIQPLVYLGGVFYSVQSLPGIWGTITKFDPVFYIINGFRYGFLGVADVPVWVCAAVLGGFAVGLLLMAWYLLRIGLGLRQ